MTGINPEKIDAVFFDFEGTVVDFQWNLRAAVEETLSALDDAGYGRHLYGPNPGYAFIYNHSIGLPSSESPPLGRKSARGIIDPIYDRYDQDALSRWQLYEDTIDVLSFLTQRGFKLGMVSNVGRVALAAAMSRLEIERFFHVIISRDDMRQLKPDPEGLLIAAQALQLSPSRVLFVGDSRNDVAAANAAGMASCYLIGGEDAPALLYSFSPTYTIHVLSQLVSRMVE